MFVVKTVGLQDTWKRRPENKYNKKDREGTWFIRSSWLSLQWKILQTTEAEI